MKNKKSLFFSDTYGIDKFQSSITIRFIDKKKKKKTKKKK